MPHEVRSFAIDIAKIPVTVILYLFLGIHICRLILINERAVTYCWG